MADGTVYRAALVGVGRAVNSQGQKGGGHQIGYTHGEMYRRSPRAELVAGVDISAENLAAFRGRFEGVAGYADLAGMLEAVRPDVVSLATYVGLRRRMIEQCARAGVKAVFCEKPFLASPRECGEVRKLVDETGVKIVVAHPRRHRPAVVRIRELIAQGAIGKVRMYLSGIGGWDINEMGAHWFDLYRYMHADRPIQWVMGQARVRGARGYGHAMEEHALAYFSFDDGARGVLDGGEGMAGPDNITVVGTEGVIRLIGEEKVVMENGNGRMEEDYAGVPPRGWDGIGVKGKAEGWITLWDCMLADLVTWLDGGAEPNVGFSSAIQTCEVTLGAYASAALGDRVELPLAGKAAEIGEYPVEILARRNPPTAT